jgi:hypothetical protein
MKFNVLNITNGLFYIHAIIGASDFFIADICKLHIKKYQDILLTKFNAIFYTPPNGSTQIYFKEKEDAEKAIEWIESIIVMNKLTN